VRLLVVKTSSLGDVVHSLPAVTDAARAIPNLRIDWVVEEGFQEIPAWHPAVEQVIPVAIRRWRKNIIKNWRGPEWRQFRTALKQQHYDCVIDAQGLLKSAWLTRLVKAPCYGLDRRSIREPIAALAYHHRIAVPRDMHAVERVRELFSQALNYQKPDAVGDYGIDRERFASHTGQAPYVVFLHGTTRADKHWPEPYWCELCQRVTAAGWRVLLPWGNETEKKRAQLIAGSAAMAQQAAVLPRLNLNGVAGVLAGAAAVVAVDTGLGHLSAALDVPAISLYGSTSPKLVGAYGRHQLHLEANDYPMPTDLADVEPALFAGLNPDIVWQQLQELLP